MEDLKRISAEISSIGEAAKEYAAFLQAASRQANQLSQMIDSYIHGAIRNDASEICATLTSAGDQMMQACFNLMQVWSVSQRWLTSHVPVAPSSTPPIGTAFPFVPDRMDPALIDDSQNHTNPKSSSADDQRADSDSITMRGYKTINGSHTMMEDLKNTNPKWKEDSPWDVNCQRCVSAYEARRRGYDVTAAPLLDENDTLQIMRHPNGWPSVYQGADIIDCTASSGTGSEVLVDDQMAAWGDGARAIVRVRWKLGGGHVFIAERVNGRTVYMDPQHGTMNVGDYFYSAKGNGTFCVRIDNLPFTDRIHDCIV